MDLERDRGREGGREEKVLSSERASQGEQNGVNFSFVTPSSKEL